MNISNYNRKFDKSSRNSTDYAQLSIAVFALALVILSDNFWILLGRLNENFGVYSAFSQIIEAGILAAGLVLFVARWEKSIKIILSVWVLIFPLLLAYASAIWSVSALDSIRGAIIMLLSIFFAVAIAGQLNSRALAQTSTLSALLIAILGLIAQYLKVNEDAAILHNASDFGFLLISSIWALSQMKKARILWLALAFLGFGCAFYFGGGNIFGAVLGLACAFVLNLVGKMRSRAVEKLAIFWAWIAILVTIVAILRGTTIANSLSELFNSLGSRAAFGTGYETAGNTIYAQFGIGLGALGVCTGFMTIAILIASAYLNGKVSFGTSLALLGIGGQLIFSPGQISLTGPCVIIFMSCIYRTIIAKSFAKHRPGLIRTQ